MEFTSYNAELAIAQLLFQRLFSNIKIERTDTQGRRSWLKIPCVMGQRSRIIKGLENPERKANYTFPMIAINRTGYSRNGERLNNMHNEVKYEISPYNRDYDHLTPVPIDISFDVAVLARYQADIDKIASNFMVFFNPDVYVSQDHPKYHGIKLNSQVIMQDSVSEEHPDEVDPAQGDFITCTFQFTFKTYLFGGVKKARIKTTRQEISSYISSGVSSYVYRFNDDDEVRKYLEEAGHASLSTTLTCEADVPVTALVETSANGEEGYDDGIPKIHKIDFGFYAVPRKHDIAGYIESVDNELICKHEDFFPPTYISSGNYVPVYEIRYDDEGNELCVLSRLSTENDYYENIDPYCSLAPYVDRIKWEIDETSPYEWPYNVVPRSHFEDLARNPVI